MQKQGPEFQDPAELWSSKDGSQTQEGKEITHPPEIANGSSNTAAEEKQAAEEEQEAGTSLQAKQETEEQKLDDENDANGTEAQDVKAESSDDDEWGEDDYRPSRQSGGVRRGAECPYLDTISRQVSTN